MSGNTPSIQLDTRVLDKLNREAPGKAKRIVKKIGFDVQAYAVQHMSTSSPSAPGEPPGVDTGLLKNSIHVEEVGEMALAWLTLLRSSVPPLTIRSPPDGRLLPAPESASVPEDTVVEPV